MGEASEQATVFFQQQNEKLYPGKQRLYIVGHIYFLYTKVMKFFTVS